VPKLVLNVQCSASLDQHPGNGLVALIDGPMLWPLVGVIKFAPDTFFFHWEGTTSHTPEEFAGRHPPHQGPLGA